MKASLSWIKEILPDLKANASAIQKRFDAVGIEVEAVTRQADSLEGVIVGEVRALAPHPDADKLRVATVFDGENEHTVVCGAPNVKEGQKVAFAPVGLTLPNGITLEPRKIRGVQSAGMICSEAELGVSDESDGILVTKPRAKPGKAIAKVEGFDDVVFELGVTPNRSDVLSHHGLARELAAVFDLDMPKASARVRESGGDAKARAKVRIEDHERCTKYAGRVLVGVKVGPSPTWVKRRLQTLGIRSISNVVDATNIVLMELGHPLHAFDLAKLSDERIVVRTATEGEKIVLLDDSEKTLVAEDLVIADGKDPVALAGVMGGANSEVGPDTVDILLESAVFDPKSVRKTARRHGLHTEASHRFERGVDFEMVETALDRCAQLIVELAGGQVLRGRLVDQKAAPKPIVVPIRAERASMLIGRAFDKKDVRSALTSLGLKSVKRPEAKKKSAKKKAPPKKDAFSNALYFQVPSWRLDLKLEEDLIEEVGRLFGYDNIPALMPPGAKHPMTGPLARQPERDVRELMVREGYSESISLAFDGDKDVEAMGLDRARAVVLENPLGEETRLMRMSLLPALLRATRLNQDVLPSITDLRLFEVGKTFIWANPPGALPVESNRIGIVLRGTRSPRSWTTKGEPVDAYDLKATVESVLRFFAVGEVSWLADETPWLHPRSATRLERDGRVLGYFGEVHPALAERYGIEGTPVFAAQLELDAIAAQSGPRPQFASLSKLPPAQRDLSFFVGGEVPAAEVVRVIEAAATDTLERVDLFDVYEGQGVPEGQKSLAVALVFRAADRTLKDEEVEAAQAAIVAALTESLGAKVRSG